jgi:hypothetical protein
MRSISMAVASMALGCTAVAAQTDPVPDVLVKGVRQSEKEQIATAARAISKPQRIGGFESQYAQWNEPLCVMVIGMPRDGGQFILDRIGTTAQSVGLRPAAPGCRPNVVVVATTKPSEFIEKARRRRPYLFGNMSIPRINQMQDSSATVRWASAWGMLSSQGYPAVPESNGLPGTFSTKSWQASRLQAPTQIRLVQMLIVVDKRRIDRLPYEAIGDYLSVIALTDPWPSAPPPSVSSVLSLFSGGPDVPLRLTDFDRSYLKARYEINPALRGDLQRAQMMGAVTKSLTQSADVSGLPPRH